MRHPCSDNRAAQFMFASPRSAKHVRTSSCRKALARMSYTRGLASFFIVATPASKERALGVESRHWKLTERRYSAARSASLQPPARAIVLVLPDTAAGEEFDHLVVLHLAELAVELPYGEELRRSFETHYLVAVRPDICEAVRRRDRHGADQPLGLFRSHRVQRRDHRCAGRQAVVHDDHDAASRVDRRPCRRVLSPALVRSEERRVGKEGNSASAPECCESRNLEH